jgi:CheY-like chemotaxis protein
MALHFRSTGNETNQFVIESLLEDMGLEFEFANNGIEAIDCMRKKDKHGRYDLVLMDCQMPEMDGYEATRQIRAGVAGKLYCGIPVIAMTANAMAGDREKCLAAGMSDYLTKPIDEVVFEKKINEWLNTSLGENSSSGT